VNNLLTTVTHHGYLLVFLIAFGEAVGLPIPAGLALLAAGAAAAAHVLGPFSLLAATAGIMLGDTILFLLGRHTGWALLGFLCNLSLNPETCILRSAEFFYKRGRVTLLFIKFVPGVNTMAAPLAGSMKMKLAQFLQLDFLGTWFYVSAYWLAGFLFRDVVARIMPGLQTATHAVAVFVLILLIVFVAYRITQFFRYRSSDLVPRVGVAQIMLRLASEGNGDLIIADVRSHGYYDPETKRIAGSIRIEPNRLKEEVKNLPRDKDIYLYCT